MLRIIGLFLLAGLVLAATNSIWTAPVVGAVQTYHQHLYDAGADQPAPAQIVRKEE